VSKEFNKNNLCIKTQDSSLSLYSEKYQQAYHSQMGAQTEAKELYMQASGFSNKCYSQPASVSIFDIGLGLGYNACMSIDIWLSMQEPGDLTITSFEKDKKLFSLLKSASALWQKNWKTSWLEWVSTLSLVEEDKYQLVVEHPLSKSKCIWTVVLGCALSSLNKESMLHPCDYIWQDPFSIDVNPELWTSEWFLLLKKISKKDAVLMTYSVARKVCDSLSAAAWRIEKIPTPGIKKSWLRASL
jgi:tRNA U34 5-methylaminomethyl-2-thiouridine-forming methyltransferase MnmC